ncbi:hypothetical protein AWB71_03292 [Caballeronia peredens]|nr:hypothetical protein AWB71_03292 [Caballeronia peredens]
MTLPDNFDPLFAALGIRRRDWTAPVQPQQPTRLAGARDLGDAC